MSSTATPTTIEFLGLSFELAPFERDAGIEGHARYRMRAENVPGEWDPWVVRQAFSAAGQGKGPDGNPIWRWDGNRESPTLSPSFAYGALERDGWRVHFFLTGGVICPCGDQTAEVVG